MGASLGIRSESESDSGSEAEIASDLSEDGVARSGWRVGNTQLQDHGHGSKEQEIVLRLQRKPKGD